MTDYNQLLDAFEQALELERELGTRTVDCDRTLLSPPTAPAPVAPAVPKPVPVTPSASKPVAAASSPRPAPVVPPVPKPAPRPVQPAVPAAAVGGALVDFAFLTEGALQGAAQDLLVKMVAAMGYALTQVTVVPAATAVAAPPRARVYIVLGSEAFKQFAPGQRAALGLWTRVRDVPTVVTYSPARILSYFGNDAAALTNAKRQIWSDLKSALARIGKQPPARR